MRYFTFLFTLLSHPTAKQYKLRISTPSKHSPSIISFPCGMAYSVSHRRLPGIYSPFPKSLISLSFGVFFSSFLSSGDDRVNKTTLRMTIGPKYNELRDWHHGVSARTLNVQ